MKFDKHNIHQHKGPISINNIDINILNILLVKMMVKKLDFYVYCFHC